MLFMRNVVPKVSIVRSCFENDLCYSSSMCYSNILSLCLVKVRDFMWKYYSKMSVHFITKKHIMVFEPEILFVLDSVMHMI